MSATQPRAAERRHRPERVGWVPDRCLGSILNCNPDREANVIMRKSLALASLFLLFVLPGGAARIGDAAPAFSATDSNGQQHNLAQYKGKFVVLEWHNQGCPYTKKHYDSGNMQKLQKYWTGKQV